MVLEDGTLVLGQQGHAVWARPDGLASVRSTMFMDLPTSQELAEERRDVTSVLDALRDRIRFEFLNVKVCARSVRAGDSIARCLGCATIERRAPR